MDFELGLCLKFEGGLQYRLLLQYSTVRIAEYSIKIGVYNILSIGKLVAGSIWYLLHKRKIPTKPTHT